MHWSMIGNRTLQRRAAVLPSSFCNWKIAVADNIGPGVHQRGPCQTLPQEQILLSIKSLLSTAFSVHCVLSLRWADLAEYQNRTPGTRCPRHNRTGSSNKDNDNNNALFPSPRRTTAVLFDKTGALDQKIASRRVSALVVVVVLLLLLHAPPRAKPGWRQRRW